MGPHRSAHDSPGLLLFPASGLGTPGGLAFLLACGAPEQQLGTPQRDGAADGGHDSDSEHPPKGPLVYPIDAVEPNADFDRLSARLTRLVEDLEPLPEEVAQVRRCVEDVRRLLGRLLPGCRLETYGSTANGLNLRGGMDIDTTVLVEGVGDDRDAKAKVVEQIGAELERLGMADLKVLSGARVPIVKFRHTDTGVSVDVTVNNLLAVENTRLLRDYTRIDARLRPMVLLVKHWAKRRQLNDAFRGSLSSYAYVLMCVHSLQTREPPVLPVLQAMKPREPRDILGRDCSYFRDIGAPAKISAPLRLLLRVLDMGGGVPRRLPGRLWAAKWRQPRAAAARLLRVLGLWAQLP